MQNTKIEWCDHTFNPWMGCAKVSAGCDHCYAERQMDTRMGRVTWGANGTRVRTGVAYWRQPLRWNIEADGQACGDCDPCIAGQFWNCCISPQPRPRVFCASLADVFEPDYGGPWGLDAWRAELFDLIRRTPNLDWLMLTKRPAKVLTILRNAADRLLKTAGFMNTKQMESGATAVWISRWLGGMPPPNVWIGATVENQEMADSRIPDLLRIPARVRFLSCEPLLGSVDLEGLVMRGVCLDGLGWVIAGGESGPKARPMHLDWARSLRDQCRAAGVPFLFKQWGEWAPTTIAHFSHDEHASGKACIVAPDGAMVGGQRLGDAVMARVGKKAAGRTLDGRTWDEFPSP